MSRPIQRLPMRGLQAPTPEARALLREVAPIVEGHASGSERDRLSYARDQWARGLIWARAGQTPPPPEVIAWPSSTEQVAALTRLAARLGAPLVAFGCGSGSRGSTCATRGGILLDLKRMDRILELDVEAREVECQAGIVGRCLETALAAHGVTAGHHPLSLGSSTVGGWIATRQPGQAAGRYGGIEEIVGSITAVDGTGQTIVTPRRPAAGWDGARAFFGSEGSFGTICSARLRLVPRPESQAFQAFAFRSLAAGLEALRTLVRAGVRPAIARLHDPAESLLLARAPAEMVSGRRHELRERVDAGIVKPVERLIARSLGGARAYNRAAELLREHLLVLVFEGEQALVELEAEESARACVSAGGEELGPEPARAWMQDRYAEAYRRARIFDSGAFADTMEVSVGWGQALEAWQEVRAATSALALVGCRFEHAGLDGCGLSFSFVGPPGALEQTERRHDELMRAALGAASAAGASLCGPVGLAGLNTYLEQLGDGMRLVRGLKAAFDPKGIMNPGKLGA